MKDVKINIYLYEVGIKEKLNKTYVSSSHETLFRVSINVSLTQEKYPFFLTCFYIFDEDLCTHIIIMSRNENLTQHITVMFVSRILLFQQQ